MIRLALLAFVAGFAWVALPAAWRTGRPGPFLFTLGIAVVSTWTAFDVLDGYGSRPAGMPFVPFLDGLSSTVVALACAAGGAITAGRTVSA